MSNWSVFKPKSTEEVLQLLGRRLTDQAPAEQQSLTDRPEEPEPVPAPLGPEPERGPDALYERLVALSIEGVELYVGGTDEEPKLRVDNAHKDLLTPADLELFREHKPYVLAWVEGITEMRAPRRRLKAGVKRWFDQDEDSLTWVLAFCTRPDLGVRYVRGQLWQVVGELRELGVKVRDEEREEVLPLVVMEVAAEIAKEGKK